MNKLIVGGVPEHFNAPWHLAVEQGIFRDQGVEVQFKEIPEGTGKMCAGLREGSLDVALVLTEGIIKDIIDGNPSKLIATYVESPLTWGIFVNPKSNIHTVEDLRGKTIGISRFGSGSHLMSFVLADEKEWTKDGNVDLKFAIKNNLTGLREGIRDGTCDAFLWERIMTKPFVDSGELKQVGVTVTPWPCFMIAVRNEVLQNRLEDVQKMISGIQESCRRFKNDAQNSIELVSKKFHLQKEDAEKWFNEVRFSETGKISRRVLVSTIDTLIRAKIIPGYHDEKGALFSFGTLYDAHAQVADVDSTEIRTVKLYYTKRLQSHLKALSKDLDTGKKLSVPELKEYDLLHYYGEEVIDKAGSILSLNPSKKVLEVGSGLGGPARYMAWKYGCSVVAVEIEEERQSLANTLTSRCDLTDKVEHICGDASTLTFQEESLDAFVSWLSILHIKQNDRDNLFSNLFKALKKGGSFVIEDFYAQQPLTATEISDLDVVVATPYCPSESEYVAQLKRAGFEDIKCEDLSDSWRQFVDQRLKAFEQNRKSMVELYGEKVVNGVGYFYSVINRVYQSGHLGGIRITGRKPL